MFVQIFFFLKTSQLMLDKQDHIVEGNITSVIVHTSTKMLTLICSW